MIDPDHILLITELKTPKLHNNTKIKVPLVPFTL
jgi:hypothetical protein